MNMIELSGRNILGNSLSGEGKIIFYAEDPTSGTKIEPGFHEASEKEIRLAIDKAGTAFHLYRNKTGKEQAEFLEAIVSEIARLGDEINQGTWKVSLQGLLVSRAT